ncbi:30S ribosomal protein S7 [Anaplasmataceae bacterium AB001_6]|nr:30S ribosomal protein S7 [Anaplasmataceae bacterium AB001_6]
MSRRRRKIHKKVIEPDCRYQSVFIAKLINIIMFAGKKSIASAIVYDAINLVIEKKKCSVEELVDDIIKNLAPNVELKSCRIGGTNYQVPVKVGEERSHSIAMKWLKNAAIKRKGKAMYLRLADEIQDLLEGKGEAYKKHENNNKMAESNKAFAHFRWSN